MTSLAIFVGSLFLLKFVHTDFMPESDESRITASVELQTGARVEETIKTARYLEQVIREKIPEVEIMSVSSGADDEGGMFSLFATTGSNIINLMMRLSPIDERERSVWDIGAVLREEIAALPEVINFDVTTSGSGMGGGGSSTVDVEIFGYDFDITNKVTSEVEARLMNVPGGIDVQVSRKDDKPELQFVLDRDKLALHGLTTAYVSTIIRNRVIGMLGFKI